MSITSQIAAMMLLITAFAPICITDIHRTSSSSRSSSTDPSLRHKRLDPNIMSSSIGFSSNSTDAGQMKLFQAQAFSVLASFLVGLAGILPLMIIPIEAGPNLKAGAGARRLRLLLSFAVGGLLGDVFLHLLPESWKHLANNDEAAHRTMGFWVLAGIFTFIFIEMIFAHTEIEESSEDNSEKNCIKENGNYITENGNLIHRRRKSSTKVLANGTSHQSDDIAKLKSAAANPSKANRIDVAGYLNLFANMMDNFTHGLAISASFLNSTRVGVLTTFAILIHEIPHEIGDFAILLKSGFDRWGAAKAQLLTASFGLCGALTALCVESTDDIGAKTAFLLPFTAGGFIQIALVNVLPDLLQQTNIREALYQAFFIAAGVASMAVVTFMTE